MSGNLKRLYIVQYYDIPEKHTWDTSFVSLSQYDSFNTFYGFVNKDQLK